MKSERDMPRSPSSRCARKEISRTGPAIESSTGAGTISSAPSSEYSAECAALQLELLERWVGRGIQRSELSFAQRYLINSHCFDRDTPSKRLEAAVDIEIADDQDPPAVLERLLQQADGGVQAAEPLAAGKAGKRQVEPFAVEHGEREVLHLGESRERAGSHGIALPGLLRPSLRSVVEKRFICCRPAVDP